MGSQQHIHKFSRINLAKKGNPEHWVMHCSLPNCSYYIVMQSKLSCKPLWNKHSLCNKCNEPFELDKRSLRQAHPTCIDCYGNKGKKEELEKASRFFAELEKGITP